MPRSYSESANSPAVYLATRSLIMSSLIRSVSIGSYPVSDSFLRRLSWAVITWALYCYALNFSNRSGKLTPNIMSWLNISYSF